MILAVLYNVQNRLKFKRNFKNYYWTFIDRIVKNFN